jgi:cardiolipin synthase A/B
MKRRAAKWLIAGFTFLATALAVLLIANLSLGDKHIEQRVETLYSTADAQFRRNMNVMFGPALVAGNRTQALVNGDRFFADMLKSIRAAESSARGPG